MGTSASATGPNNQSPLVPPWAEQGNSIEFESSGDIDSGQEPSDENNQQIDNEKVQEQISKPVNTMAKPNRLSSARSSFGEYASGGGGLSNLRRSLRKYAQGSGGGAGTSKRLASGISAGTGLLRMMTGDSVTISNNTLSLVELNGLTTDQAIDKIAEHLTPENGDADSVRIAINYALAEALPDDEDFNVDVVTEDVMHETLFCYLTDLIFQDVVTGMGSAWFHTEHASKHYYMEEELRELIKVITQQQVEELTYNSTVNITKDNMTQLQIDVITRTVEIWEIYND